jgi:hypothetical protein
MSLGLHETRQRRQRRFRWALTKWVIALGLIVGAGVFAYRTGTGLAERKVTTLSREIVTLSDKAAALEQQTTEMRANEILLEKRLSDAERRYEKDVPAGRLAALLGQIQAKLDSGVEMARLEFLIASADNPRECETVPATKRFLVQTPLFSGANDSVSYAKGAITVTAQGESAVSAAGQVEAWYDPAKPVTARFTAIGGRVQDETGTLPLHTSVVQGGNEYRFTMVAAESRGFVQVTGDRCNYP